MAQLEADAAVGVLKAAAEPTRLRMLALLQDGELNVSDLTRILGQSQPRISRHLKLLVEAGLVVRFREGSWVYFHLSERSAEGALGRAILAAIDRDDRVLRRDLLRSAEIKAEREAAAQAYFKEHAGDWDRIRTLHVGEADVERAMRDALDGERLGLLVDLGTGTGRVLELMADRFDRGIGLDINQAMLAYARSRLDRAGLSQVQVRHGDIYNLPVEDQRADAVVMHQVLHFLADPQRAIREAARVLRDGGRLMIVDFAPHELEFMRDELKHQRLGFSPAQVEQWLGEAGLSPMLSRLLPQDDGKADRLTVALWVGRRDPRGASRRSATRSTLEATRTSA